MKKALAICLFVVSLFANAQTTHNLPTTDGTNAWTGVNNYAAGKLVLGTVNQVCPTNGLMTGITTHFVPVCQYFTGVTSINNLSGGLALQAGANVTITAIGNTFTIASTGGGGGTGAVSSVNSIVGAVNVTAGTGISVTPTGQNIAVANTGVTTVNSIAGAVTFAAGSNITLTPSGNTITIASSGGSSGVSSFNTLTGAVTISAGTGISLTPSGNNIAIANTATPVSTLNTLSGAVTIAAGTGVTLSTSGNTITVNATGTGSGSVTSVGLTVPSWLTVTGSPVTSSGTLAVSGTSQLANLVLASPNGSNGAVSPRALVAADIPALPYISALTGDVTASGSGSVGSVVKGLNGIALSGLATGLLQNTSGTGVPTIATSYNLSGSGQLGTWLATGTNTVSCTATPVFNAALGDTQFLTITQACPTITSSSLTNLQNGQLLRILICQDSTGGKTFPNPAWANGWAPPTLAANGCTSQLFIGANGGAYADGYNTAFGNSSNSPATDGNAVRGFFAVPAGTNPTLTINTTAVGPQSIVLFSSDTSIGPSMSPTVSCGSSIPTGPLQVTGRASGSNFTVQVPGTISGFYCGGYTIVNP